MPFGGDRKFAAILLSRQPRRPCGRDGWVVQTEKAVSWLKESGRGIVSSVGLPTWELITALASRHGLRLRLFVPATTPAKAERLAATVADEFGSTADRTEIIPLVVSGRDGKNRAMGLRDQAVVSSADFLLPISIRTGGKMAALIEAATTGGIQVDRRFQFDHCGRGEKLAYTVDLSRCNPDLLHLDRPYLIHWTRAANGPWPGERAADYYSDVVASARYPRSAFDTIKRILATQQIIASPRHMPNKTATVAFSGLSPREVAPLMRWRARFGEMSFEPYGIGIAALVAARAGISAVQYYDKEVSAKISTEPWLLQSMGTRTDWRQEREYRHRGNLDLSKLSADDLIVFCLRPDEAAEISAQFGRRAVSFY